MLTFIFNIILVHLMAYALIHRANYLFILTVVNSLLHTQWQTIGYKNVTWTWLLFIIRQLAYHDKL